MGRNTALRHEIKERLVPVMAEKGFACDMRRAPQFLTFRKISEEAIRVFDLQWDRHGRPRFVVNFGMCGATGVIIRGERIAPEDIFPSSTPIWGRLSPGNRRSTAGWFRQDRPLPERIVTWSALRPAAEVVANLLTLLAEVEEFWTTGQAGPHIRISSQRRDTANVDQARA